MAWCYFFGDIFQLPTPCWQLTLTVHLWSICAASAQNKNDTSTQQHINTTNTTNHDNYPTTTTTPSPPSPSFSPSPAMCSIDVTVTVIISVIHVIIYSMHRKQKHIKHSDNVTINTINQHNVQHEHTTAIGPCAHGHYNNHMSHRRNSHKHVTCDMWHVVLSNWTPTDRHRHPRTHILRMEIDLDLAASNSSMTAGILSLQKDSPHSPYIPKYDKPIHQWSSYVHFFGSDSVGTVTKLEKSTTQVYRCSCSCGCSFWLETAQRYRANLCMTCTPCSLLFVVLSLLCVVIVVENENNKNRDRKQKSWAKNTKRNETIRYGKILYSVQSLYSHYCTVQSLYTVQCTVVLYSVLNCYVFLIIFCHCLFIRLLYSIQWWWFWWLYLHLHIGWFWWLMWCPMSYLCPYQSKLSGIVLF